MTIPQMEIRPPPKVRSLTSSRALLEEKASNACQLISPPSASKRAPRFSAIDPFTYQNKEWL